ncbi:enoyl-ACP reductase [PVC group bacterium]|nr:enoyl-ACP reductase [PVC group bacterium]
MLLNNKKGVIVGVANKRSIAWAIAESLSREGAKLGFTYQTERLLEKVKSLVEGTMPGSPLCECDVSNDDHVKKAIDELGQALGKIDFLVHSVAFANKDDLNNGFVNTSRDGFKLSMDISAYSLVSLARAAAPYMTEGGSIVAMTYLGSTRVVPGYNVMGVAKAALEASLRYLANELGAKNIRVNGISAGPINTLAARGLSSFTALLKYAAERSPFKRNTDPSEVGDTALFLVSNLSRGITGEIIHVDTGLHMLAQ